MGGAISSNTNPKVPITFLYTAHMMGGYSFCHAYVYCHGKKPEEVWDFIEAAYLEKTKEEIRKITDTMNHNVRLLDRMSLMLFDSSARGTTEERYAKKNDLVACNQIARDAILKTVINHGLPAIKFDTDLSDEFCIYTSYVYLMRSIREILYNSSKYSDGQHISLHVTERDSMVYYIFEDKGPGISQEEMGKMFDMFTKVSDFSEGLGLGLPLTKRHLVTLGGDLELDTDYHDGCRFIMKLPVN